MAHSVVIDQAALKAIQRVLNVLNNAPKYASRNAETSEEEVRLICGEIDEGCADLGDIIDNAVVISDTMATRLRSSRTRVQTRASKKPA